MTTYLTFFLQILLWPLPWIVRKYFYRIALNAQIEQGALIGRSLIGNIGSIHLGPNAKIGNLNVIRNLDRLTLGANSKIGNFNWIAGYRSNKKNKFFKNHVTRRSELLIGDEGAIVARHIIDCTDAVHIGRFSIIAGHRSQILTHAIDIEKNTQTCGPVTIGDYSFVGTGVIILKNSNLPSYAILGAGAILLGKLSQEYVLYAGNPARKIKEIDQSAGYFNRQNGFVG